LNSESSISLASSTGKRGEKKGKEGEKRGRTVRRRLHHLFFFRLYAGQINRKEGGRGKGKGEKTRIMAPVPAYSNCAWSREAEKGGEKERRGKKKRGGKEKQRENSIDRENLAAH